jgi:hypothetical protein
MGQQHQKTIQGNQKIWQDYELSDPAPMKHLFVAGIPVKIKG